MLVRVIVAAALLVPIAAFGHEPPVVAPGTRDDMKGATTVFVDTAVDPETREAIVLELGRQLPNLRVVEHEEESALVLRFSTSIPESRPLDDDPVGSAADGRMRSQSNPDHVPTPGSLTAAQRTTNGTSPRIADVADSPSVLDSMAPPAPGPGLYRYASGSVLKVSGANRYTEALTYSQGFTSSTAAAARAFVRKFAKAYRQANRTTK
ncbi:MAG TPA: hypothetical protein PLF26_03420 [Blastocatellia bacterium]|nr:hypothetical protein [Blastocatellia bacterium]